MKTQADLIKNGAREGIFPLEKEDSKNHSRARFLAGLVICLELFDHKAQSPLPSDQEQAKFKRKVYKQIRDLCQNGLSIDDSVLR